MGKRVLGKGVVISGILNTYFANQKMMQCVQGDPSGGLLALVDIKTEVPSQYILLTLKCNFQFDVNKS